MSDNFLNRKFGIELEFSQKTSREFLFWVIKQTFPNDEVKITRWQKNVDNTEWFCKTDSSCGYELVTPVLYGNSGLFKIKKIIHSLKENGARFDRKCGIHVHVECKDLTIYNISKLILYWFKFEPFILSMFPKHRVTNKYCQPLTQSLDLNFLDKYIPSNILKANHKNKNKALNTKGYNKRGTVEFRLMESNLNQCDIINWIIFCLYFFNIVNKNKKPSCIITNNILDFNNFLNFDKKTSYIKDWMIKRMRKYKRYKNFNNYDEFLNKKSEGIYS